MTLPRAVARSAPANIRPSSPLVVLLPTCSFLAPISFLFLFQNGEQFVVDLFERYVVQRNRLGFLELHPAAFLRSLEFAELDRQSLFRSA